MRYHWLMPWASLPAGMIPDLLVMGVVVVMASASATCLSTCIILHLNLSRSMVRGDALRDVDNSTISLRHVPVLSLWTIEGWSLVKEPGDLKSALVWSVRTGGGRGRWMVYDLF